jgi:hypothetical protein
MQRVLVVVSTVALTVGLAVAEPPAPAPVSVVVRWSAKMAGRPTARATWRQP